jgi:hypothetical protein
MMREVRDIIKKKAAGEIAIVAITPAALCLKKVYYGLSFSGIIVKPFLADPTML